ncbi:SUMF1/EgtB/PvdO family nonheme iron enzyme [Chloroflexota bacterium]
MKLFISYARVDKPYCIQIVDTLEVHPVWYDQRLYAGYDWWKEILARLDWCEGFVYLISADSIASEYCRKEFELALSLGRHIIPVLIDTNVELPEELASVQYVDFTNGITPNAVKMLLNSIYIAERQPALLDPLETGGVDKLATDERQPPASDATSLISAAVAAMEKSQFDQAVYLLKQAKDKNFTSQFINLAGLLEQAEAGLARQTYLIEARREYNQISELVKYNRTRKLGIEAFLAFQKAFPDYDPGKLAQYCPNSAKPPEIAGSSIGSTAGHELPPAIVIPLLDWCAVPAGRALLYPANHARPEDVWTEVDAFEIAKYPVTITQYQLFLDAADGYADKEWWAFSEEAQTWRADNPEPRPSQFDGVERPREMVNWYDAVAYCRWISVQLKMEIRLPTEAEWIRAARGEERWLYPWGDQFEVALCNTSESKIHQTTPVTHYEEGVSPWSIWGLSGNVWEWCQDAKDSPDTDDLTGEWERAVHGGSYIGPANRAQVTFSYYLKPFLYYSSIGFRLLKVL